MQTIGQRLDTHRGIAPGFDFLRIALALGVVGYHAPQVATGADIGGNGDLLWDVPDYAILAMFFSLSGFLITGSAQRLSLGNFLINRGLRIVPALAVEIVLCALVLGAVFTTMTLLDYLSQPGTWHYFTNIAGVINYQLPGVFKDHPSDIVNKSLWTVPHEIGCYVIMSVFMLMGAVRNHLQVAASIMIFLMLSVIVTLSPLKAADGVAQAVIVDVFTGGAPRLYILFMAGILAFQLRDRLPYSPILFVACAAFTVLVIAFQNHPFMVGPVVNLLLCAPIAYMTAFIGVTAIWMPKFLRKGDYSYGIYLYGWPMQQVVYTLLPANTPAWLHFLAVLPLIFGFAAFSWHFIEKPILQQRKKFSFVARVRLEEEQADNAKKAAAGSAAAAPAPVQSPASSS